MHLKTNRLKNETYNLRGLTQLWNLAFLNTQNAQISCYQIAHNLKYSWLILKTDGLQFLFHSFVYFADIDTGTACQQFLYNWCKETVECYMCPECVLACDCHVLRILCKEYRYNYCFISNYINRFKVWHINFVGCDILLKNVLYFVISRWFVGHLSKREL